MQPELRPYCDILGVPFNADESVIKKRYRKLVVQYHPDKNPGYEKQFIEITEAYEILIGKKTLPKRTSITRPSSNTPEAKAKEREERIKQAQQRYKEQKINEYLENERYFKKLTTGWRWKVIRLNAVFGVIFTLCMMIEHFIPAHYTESRVDSYSRTPYNALTHNRVSLVALENGNRYFIGNLTANIYSYYPEVYEERTWIFHNPINLISVQDFTYQRYSIHWSIGSLYLFWCLIFCLPLYTLLFKRRTIFYSFMHSISCYGVGLMIFYFLFTNDRWIHFLTLGFI